MTQTIAGLLPQEIQTHGQRFRQMIEQVEANEAQQAAKRVDPLINATPKQRKYILDLATQVPAEIQFSMTTWMNSQPGPLDRKQIHNLIERLKARRVFTKPAEVPADRYALRVDGVVHFYKVERPTVGKYAGRVFVKAQAGDELLPIRGAGAQIVLEQIAVDVEAAYNLYRDELDRCRRCTRTLTDEVSRAAHLGPDCRAIIAAEGL